MARDCTVKSDPNAAGPQAVNSNKGNFDSEYANLMAELGESAGGGGVKSWGGSGAPSTVGTGSDIPPWRRPEMWQSTTPGANNQAQGYRPPQQYGATAGYGAGYNPTSGQGQGWYQGGGAQSYPQGYGGQQDYSAAYAQYYQSQYNQAQTASQ